MPFVEVSHKEADFYWLLMAGLSTLYSVLCKPPQNLLTSEDFSSCLIIKGRRQHSGLANRYKSQLKCVIREKGGGRRHVARRGYRGRAREAKLSPGADGAGMLLSGAGASLPACYGHLWSPGRNQEGNPARDLPEPPKRRKFQIKTHHLSCCLPYQWVAVSCRMPGVVPRPQDTGHNPTASAPSSCRLGTQVQHSQAQPCPGWCWKGSCTMRGWARIH